MSNSVSNVTANAKEISTEVPVSTVDLDLKIRLIPKDLFELEQKIEEIRCYFNPQTALSVAIVKDGKVFLTKGFGPKVPNKPEKVDEKTLFNIGSVTKSFVSLIIASLVSEGKLDFTSNVKKIFGDFNLVDAELTEKVNLIHVLSHQTSLPRHDEIYLLKKRLEISDLFNRMSQFELIPEGFGKYSYSNHMYTLAAEISSKVNKKPFPETLREKVLKPATMNDTILWEEVADKSNLNIFTAAALDFDALSDSQIPEKFTALPFSANDDLFTGCGGLLSNAVDMAGYIQFLISRATGSLIKDAEFAEVFKCHIERNNKNKDHYGLGFAIGEYEGNLSWSHGGAVFGYMSMLRVLPEKNLGVFVAANGDNFGLLCAADVILDALLEIPFEDKKNHPELQSKAVAERMRLLVEEVAKTKKSDKTMHQLDLSKYAGNFYNPAYGKFSITINNSSKKIEGKLLDSTFFDFIHFDKEEFRCKVLYPNVNWAAQTFFNRKTCWFDLEDGEVVSVRLDLEPQLEKGVLFLKA
ncbi:hypothetical protein HK099_008454 [Clydaea vesicula]|uniref:Beta-lactamase-related domain-containing protein n=1 Tax=Clydaea vesicula TaxID=447962 RepID=A0AAD5XXM0_9FUNG|nr:hypothetical protein HK099_008454 [Clydaea vesicula]